jgi:hypothetical protein
MHLDINTVHNGIQRVNLDNVILTSIKMPSVIFNCLDDKVIEFGLRQTTEQGAVFIQMDDDLMEQLLVAMRT